MRKIGAFEVVDHGIEHSQYFTGCGVAFTPYTDCATGIGDNPAGALEDLLETVAQQGFDVADLEPRILEDLDLSAMPESPSVSDDADGEDRDGCELFYHLSLRWT